MANVSDALNESLHRLMDTHPPSFLAPNLAVSETARAASRHLFSALRPCSRKSPLDELLVDGFDAEQIWHQIDLMSQPLVSSLRRGVTHFVKNPEEVSQMKGPNGKKVKEEKGGEDWGEESDGFDEELEDGEEEDEEEEEEEKVEVKKGRKGDDVEEEEEDEEGGEEESEEEEEDGERGDRDGGGGGIEDEFLKIDELAKYLEKEEEIFENGDADNKGEDDDDDDDDDDEEEGEESDEDAEFFGDDDKEDEEAEDMENSRYEDFFGTKKGKGSKKRAQLLQDSGDSDDDMEFGKQKKGTGSTHQKQLEKIQSKIEQMEKANLEPKTWTMQGEVTAAKRPKNSALEVDLDFDHNVRPAPVITEEVTASIEDMIKKRIIEGHFNDVQRAPKLPSKVPREVKELDDNKSKQGLAEIYEQEYVEKKDPSSAPLSFRDELKNQISILSKNLNVKLDALSHFHFAPKPVIEDMSVQVNVPALAMEEIAPVAVSDAAMLAPEEVFDGKGDIKEEAELTKEERKRRRANKKRKFKAAGLKKPGKKVQEGALPSQVNG